MSDGVLCMSWSPDQDLVVMVTGTGNLLLMTREFDPLTEVPINSEDFGEGMTKRFRRETPFNLLIILSFTTHSQTSHCWMGQKRDTISRFPG